MKTILKIAASILLAIPAYAQNLTTVTATKLEDINGTVLANGSMCFQITDDRNNPISVQIGGGGQSLRRAYCSPVSAGTVTSFTVPNPANTMPSGIFYRVTVTDSASKMNVLTYTLVTFSGGSFNFDNYAPTIPIPAMNNNVVNGNMNVNGNLTITGNLIGPAFGTVTSFSAGTLSPLFTTSVATATTTPALTFSLSNAAADSVLGNPTGSSAGPSYNVLPSCTDTVGQHLNYTLGSGFSCGTSAVGTGTVTNVATSTPLSGGPITTTGTLSCPTCTTNASALTSGQLVKGAGGQATQTADLTGDVTTAGGTATTLANVPTGVPMAGSIISTEIAAPSSPAAGKDTLFTDSTDLRLHDKNASGVIGTTVVADTGAANNFLTAISAAGAISKARPTCANLSNAATSCSTDTTVATNITSGTLPAGQMPALTNDVTTSAGTVSTTVAKIGGTVVSGNGTTEVDIGPADTVSNGCIGVKGKTSGTANICAPAAAGTATNPLTVSNSLQLPTGTVYNWNADTGLSRAAAAAVAIGNGTAGDTSGSLRVSRIRTSGSAGIDINGTNWVGLGSALVTWNSNSDGSGNDTGLSRGSAKVVDVGNGSAADVSGYIKTGQTLQVTANFTTASLTLVAVTGLTFTAPTSAATKWSFSCDLVYSEATGTAANLFGIITTQTAPTNLLASADVYTSNAMAGVNGSAIITTATSTTVVTATTSAFGAIGTAADMFNAHFYGTVEAPSNASPTQVAIAVATGNASDSLTIYRGSACWFY